MERTAIKGNTICTQRMKKGNSLSKGKSKLIGSLPRKGRNYFGYVLVLRLTKEGLEACNYRRITAKEARTEQYL
jgi:hypothetical protein